MARAGARSPESGAEPSVGPGAEPWTVGQGADLRYGVLIRFV